VLIFGHGNLEPGNLLNSRESFIVARDSGADGVELDVRVTCDGALAIIHDAEFPDGTSVSDAHSNDRPEDVILLSEALDLCRGLLVNIEIKNYPSDPCFDPTERVTSLVVDLLEERNNEDRVLISCFGSGSLVHVRERRPDIAVALLLFSRKSAAETLAPCVAGGFAVVHPYAPMVDDEFLRIARENAMRVNAWTGFDESEELAARMIRLGVDGLITPYPPRAVRLRDTGS
jgi:glycerophosphoryl diester phosphodiesterase